MDGIKEEEEEELDEYNVGNIPQPSFVVQFSPIPTNTKRKEFGKIDGNSLILDNEIKVFCCNDLNIKIDDEHTKRKEEIYPLSRYIEIN